MKKQKSFHSSLVRHPKCTYWGNYGKWHNFEFKTKEQLLTIRFDDYPYQLGIEDSPSFINAELTCIKTGDSIEYTTRKIIAKKLLNNLDISK